MLCLMYMKGWISHEEFKQQTFAKRPDVKRAYDELEVEYLLINKIIDARLERGMTQKELAKMLGTKQSAISRFEAGGSNPTMAFLYKLAHALDVKLKISVV